MKKDNINIELIFTKVYINILKSIFLLYTIKTKMSLKCENNISNLANCDIIRSIFNISEIYIMLLEKDGTILFCSERMEKLFQVDTFALCRSKHVLFLTGKKLSDILCDDIYEELRKMMLESIFTNKQIIKEIFINKWFKFIIYPISDEQTNINYLMINGFDISKNKRMEQEIIDLKEKLEDAISIKSIFLSNISHELKTPMNAIIGFSELLLEPNNNQKDRFLKSINSNAKHLDELLDNILDYAKIESNEFDLLYENFSINELFEELFDIFKDVNYKKNLDFVKLEFEIGNDKKIICDYLRLKQVLYNIISNAIKFTERGYIKIKFEELDDSIIFSIEDSGIGIPSDKIKFTFDRFWQADDSSKKNYKGTGLGLSISKSIIEMLNGDIWVESILHKGSTFFVKIPLEEMKPDLVIIKSKEKINFSGKTILIVDEIPINYSLLSIYLNSLQVKMIFTYSGKDALKIYKKQKEKIDLIVLDIKLHDMDGFELSKKLKELDADCKIISKSGLEINKNGNINYHLKKPFSKDKLVSVLSELWQK